MNTHTSTPVVILLACTVLAGLPADAENPPPADLSQNAALEYWKAIALMRFPVTRQELEFYPFVEDTLINLPSQCFALRPETARWLLGDRPMIQAFSRAVTLEDCVFNLETDTGRGYNLTHLLELRRLARRALNISKAYEYVDNTEGAAEVYANLISLCRHLDQDQNITSGLSAAEILQATVAHLEGFYARQPSLEAVEFLNHYMKSLEQPIFHLDDYIRRQARHDEQWLTSDPGRLPQRLAELYGDRTSKPALDLLMSLSKEQRAELLETWLEGYRRHMEELAVSAAKPYLLGVEMIRFLDDQIEQVPADKLSKDTNPLIPLLVNPLREQYERFLLADAQLGLAVVMSQAAHYKSLIGHWPPDMATLEKYTNRSIPLDPFSGKPFHYRLRNNEPRIIARVPKWMAAKKGTLYTIDMAERKEADKKTFQAFAKVMRKKQLIENLPMAEEVPR
jgi:hypothetical protein